MTYNEETFKKLIKTRVRKHQSEAFKYFWASFALQILVYAMLGHVILKYFTNMLVVIPALAGVILYIPFTVVLLKKFKGMALAPSSVSSFVSKQHELLQSFYTFKKRYELILVPMATLIGTFVTFELYVPGSVWAYPNAAVITFLTALASCILAIREENKKSFEQPLSKLQSVLNDLNEN